jgi:hypothetical protein
MMLITFVVLAANPWSMADLKAAQSQGSSVEALEHCQDVPAAQRTSEWRELVGDAAAKVLHAHEAEDQDPFAGADFAIGVQKRFTFLSDDKTFAAARDAAVLRSLEKCVKNDYEECLSWVTPMASGVSREAALELARAVRRGGYFPYAPMPLVRRAVSGEKHDALCADGLVADVTIAALNLPAGDDAAKAAREVAFDFCFPQLQARLKQATAHAESYTLHNTCKGMRQRNALSQLSSELCKDEGL